MTGVMGYWYNNVREDLSQQVCLLCQKACWR